MPAERWLYEDAELVRLIDADSFTARVHRTFDVGFHVQVTGEAVQKFRLARINCAPQGTASGNEARLYVGNLLGDLPFTLESVGPYKYGDEWMCEVTFLWVDGPTNLSDLLVRRGYAAPWDGKGKAPLPPWPRMTA